jgi:hypothetical protein
MALSRKTAAVTLVVAAASMGGIAVANGARRAHPPRVLAVLPSSERVPSNLLRLYVQFSEPMEEGSVPQRVRLLDDSGHAVSGAFLQLDEELWDPTGRRLTLLFDPGRIKRGVRTNLEQGAPLLEGHRYRVVIDSRWRAASGEPLASGFERVLTVQGRDSVSPDPDRWTLSQLERGSRDALFVQFDEPLDHALVLRMLTVVDSADQPLPGIAAVTSADSLWSFTPVAPWSSQKLTLLVNTALEDVAGNSIARPFVSRFGVAWLFQAEGEWCNCIHPPSSRFRA